MGCGGLAKPIPSGNKNLAVIHCNLCIQDGGNGIRVPNRKNVRMPYHSTPDRIRGRPTLKKGDVYADFYCGAYSPEIAEIIKPSIM